MEQQHPVRLLDRDDALAAIHRLFTVAAVALLAVLALAVGLQRLRSDSEERVLEEREIGRLARVVFALAVDWQTAIRGYELTLDSAILGPERAARSRLPIVLDSLVALTRHDPEASRRALAFRDAVRRWDEEHASVVLSMPIVELRRRAHEMPLVGKPRFDDVRARSAELLTEVDASYDRRVARVRRNEHVALGGTTAALLALAAVLLHVRRRVLAQSSDLLLKQQQLEEQAVELEHQTDQSQEMAQQLEESNVDLLEAVAQTTEARQAIVAERQFLRAVLDSLTDGIVACNADGVLTVFNAATREMLGKPEEPLPPDQWTARYESYREDGRTPFPVEELPLFRALQGESVRDVTVVLAPPGARQRVTLISGRPVVGNEGERLGAVIAIHDVTEKRALELQLQHALRLEAVGQLAGGVAHDVNNVLAAIRGFAELLLQDLASDDQQRGDVQQICEAVDRAAMLTRQLLAFSRRQILNPEVIELNQLIPRSLKMISRLIGPGIQCNSSLASDLGRVRADAGQLEQVLVNLAVNARDAMPDGGQLTIETMNVEIDAVRANRIGGPEGAAPGRYVMLAVNDTGIGMDRATQARIFEPFFTTKEKGKGTGLGLSTVFGIVKQSGGQMSVYSEPGKGTTFRVFLPRVDDAVALRCTSAPAAPVAAAAATILVVDDDDAVRGAVRRMLAREGHTVLEAPSPREAEALWTRHQGEIDLLVTDLMMPDMNGGELAERLLAVRPGAAVLFTSGYTPDVVVRRGLVQAGAEFVPKPFMLREFVDKVHELLRARVPQGQQ